MERKIPRALSEQLLTQYFFLESQFDGLITRAEKLDIYNGLRSVFCLPESKELDELFLITELSGYSEMQNLTNYERFCRTLEYAKKTGQDINLTERDKTVLATKREALQRKKELSKQGTNTTKEQILAILNAVSKAGAVDSMCSLAFLQYNGFYTVRDTESALKYIKTAASWNSLFGNLLGCLYDSENRAAYLENISSMLGDSSQKEPVAWIHNHYGCEDSYSVNPVVKLLEQSFERCIIDRKVYDAQFAIAAHSDLISFSDKQKILLGKQKELLAMLFDLPLGIKTSPRAVFSSEASDNIPLRRENELSRITRSLKMNGICESVCKPLMIIGKDFFILDMYEDIIKKGFPKKTVVRFDAENLTDSDFVHGKDNLFIRTLGETKAADTVFVIRNCEAFGDKTLSEVRKILDYEYRKSFRLQIPAVTVDLSKISIVLFASVKNKTVEALAECSRVIAVADISDSEKSTVISAMLNSRLKLFGCEDKKLDNSAIEEIAHYETEKLGEILDEAVKTVIYEEESVITCETVKNACNELNLSNIKCEFGYIGGNNRAKN